MFVLFAQNKFSEGRKILNRLYLQYNNKLENIAIRRLLIHNLAWVEYQLKDLDNAKYHIAMIREEVESNLEYIYTNKLDYCKLLNHYAMIFEGEMDKDEYISIQLFNANTYEEIGAIGRHALAIANIYFIDKQFDKIINLIRNVYLQEDEQEKYCIEEILKELKENSIEHYKEALNITKITHIHGKGVNDNV